jgi:hypothetical protein
LKIICCEKGGRLYQWKWKLMIVREWKDRNGEFIGEKKEEFEIVYNRSGDRNPLLDFQNCRIM